MSGGGGGDRPGAAPTRPAGDDRPPAIRAVQGVLFDFAGDRIALVTMVVGAALPRVVMFEGEPFVFDEGLDPYSAHPAYVQSRPFRADGSLVKDLRP